MRKTADIKVMVQEANRMLMVTPDEWVGQRLGISALLESALHEAGVYRGFQYISEHDRRAFVTLNPVFSHVRYLSLGIVRPNGPDTEPILFPDESRKRYILDARL